MNLYHIHKTHLYTSLSPSLLVLTMNCLRVSGNCRRGHMTYDEEGLDRVYDVQNTKLRRSGSTDERRAWGASTLAMFPRHVSPSPLLASLRSPVLHMVKRARSGSPTANTNAAMKKTRRDTKFLPNKIATAENAAKVDAHPPLLKLLDAVRDHGTNADVAKGDCVVYWMRMEDLRSACLC